MNYDHKPRKKLIIGCSGSGKTTLFLEQLRSSPAKYKFVFDPEMEAARKLGWKAASTVEGLCRQFDSGQPIVFWPGRMFEYELEKGFAFFCQFAWNLCKMVDGTKLLAADEVQDFMPLHLTGIPSALRAGLNRGRREELDFLLAAQGINDVHSRIRKQATELFIFTIALTDDTAAKALRKMGISEDELTNLPHPAVHGRVGWIYLNALTRQKVRVNKPCT
jgi:hypothetical protein